GDSTRTEISCRIKG
ncbi:hypothetical protein INT46_008801, partial [Mucor plumbeus]